MSIFFRSHKTQNYNNQWQNQIWEWEWNIDKFFNNVLHGFIEEKMQPKKIRPEIAVGRPFPSPTTISAQFMKPSQWSAAFYYFFKFFAQKASLQVERPTETTRFGPENDQKKLHEGQHAYAVCRTFRCPVSLTVGTLLTCVWHARSTPCPRSIGWQCSYAWQRWIPLL